MKQSQFQEAHRKLNRSLGLFDSTMIVAGSMIGSGIFIVAAEMAREVGSAGWLMVAWIIAGLLTMAAALSYGELAAMMPHAGGQYVYLREAFSPLWGFLYGWTLFLVIQTGTIAASSVGFARYLGVLWPTITETHYIIAPIHIFPGYAISLSTAQLVSLSIIAFLTWTNTTGLKYGKGVQNVFTTMKIGSLIGVILIGLLIGWKASVFHANFGHAWTPQGFVLAAPGISPITGFGMLVALCTAQIGSLFAADAWNNITFNAGEVRNPSRNVPLSLALGTIIVMALYLGANFAYTVVLPFTEIQHAPSDRVAAMVLQAIFPGLGPTLIALAIMISAFGCMNGMILSGARAYYAMSLDGLFFKKASKLNRANVPSAALIMQGMWTAVLVLIRTYEPTTKTYGNLYSNLLDYVVSAALIFYILTIAGVFRLRKMQPNAERPYRAFGYPFVPALYIFAAAVILVILFLYRTATTVPGVVIVLLGVPVYFLFNHRMQRERERAAELV
ncbi:amino acid permease [Granulicella sp. dw_53]|uniref:APC family permease n=1 Tax=Granulicella sp. dw_53 TaxID=2719792 RepID=UPI002106FC93|nr:amino acid permease [Granulicella sp. dw_53]